MNTFKKKIVAGIMKIYGSVCQLNATAYLTCIMYRFVSE
jgi:hypothetical protein